MQRSPRASDIPNVVYDNLRAVNESRAKRHDSTALVPHLTNSVILTMMPDSAMLNWNRGEQTPLIDETLRRMWETVTFDLDSE